MPSRRCSPKALFHTLAVGLASVWCSLALASQVRAECNLDDAGTGAVVDILAADTLLLEDGRAVRLIGALPPRTNTRWSKALDVEGQIRKALKKLVLGHKVSLRFGGRRRDRYGRLLAHIFLERNGRQIWLQGKLVEDGLAVAYSFADNRACMAELQQREVAARKTEAGFWKRGLFSVRDARNPSSLRGLIHSYQIVEGEVHEVAEVRGRIYVNFDRNWRTDFTATLTSRNRKTFPDNGARLLALKGKRVRIRGWLRWRNGPEIRLTHPEQVEILGAAPENTPAARPASK